MLEVLKKVNNHPFAPILKVHETKQSEITMAVLPGLVKAGKFEKLSDFDFIIRKKIIEKCKERLH